jgi:hypothetical protein
VLVPSLSWQIVAVFPLETRLAKFAAGCRDPKKAVRTGAEGVYVVMILINDID